MRKQKIRIVSMPRMKRMNIEPAKKFYGRHKHIFYVGKFTCMENRFAYKPDGGAEMYRQWLAGELVQYETVWALMSKIFSTYHHTSDDVEIILIHDEELPPVHVQIIKDFIESMGAKL